MGEKIVLIDGHSILNRAFYGMPMLTNSEGLHTNAVYGFLNIMFKILEEEKPEYLAVAFDVKAPTFRHEIFKEYKGTRKPMPMELHEQVPILKELLHSMNILTLEKAGLEADDILGTISKRSEEKGLKVAVISGDRDLLQLATDNVMIRIPKTKKGGTEVENYNAKDVLEKYRVTPKEFIDLKALMGDTSDNIPGIPGVGEKTATNIIAEYKSIENAYANVENIKPNKAKESLRDNYEQACLSKVLATINVDADIDFELESAKILDMFNEESYKIFKRLEFKNHMSRFDIENTATKDKAAEKFEYIDKKEKAEDIFREAIDAKQAAFAIIDKEKISKVGDSDNILGLSIAFGEDKAYFIEKNEEISPEYICNKILETVEKIDKAIFIDLKSQLKHLELENSKKIFDVSIAAYLLNPIKDNYLYDDIANEFLAMPVPSKKDLLAKVLLEEAKDEKRDIFTKCVCYMSYIALVSEKVLLEKLIETDMMTLFTEIEMPLIFTLDSMEKYGIRVEKEELKKYSESLDGRIKELESEIYDKAGEKFNINSPKQLGVILFEKLNMPYAKKTKTGYSTAADVLEKLALEYPIVNSILEYRQLTKLKSTYAEGLANYIGEDNRIHITFNQTITATGRISSTEPNLQNIPIRMELGRMIRKVFVPEENYVFIDADYSQIELRVLADMSGDESLINAYRMSEDIHTATASKVFHVPIDEVTPLQRRNAKAVNFGIVYGISSFGLSQDLSISRKEAAQYIENYFEMYPAVKKFLDNLVQSAKDTGYAYTSFKRRRPIPELSSSNFMQRSFGERVAMNSPIQGTAADIIKIAMIRVDKELKLRKMKSRLILQVHDELLVEAHNDEIEEVKEIIKKEMMGAASLAIPLEIDMNIGKNWYEAK